MVGPADFRLWLRTKDNRAEKSSIAEIIWLFRAAMAETEREVVLQGAEPGIRKGDAKYLLSLSQVAPGLQPGKVKPWALGVVESACTLE